MHFTTKKLVVIVNKFAAKTVSESETRSMNDFGAIDVSGIGTVLVRSDDHGLEVERHDLWL